MMRRLVCGQSASSLLCAVLGSLGLAGATAAQSPPSDCPIPEIASRIAPAEVGVQSFAGVLHGASEAFEVRIPANAHLQIEAAVQRVDEAVRWPWWVTLEADGEHIDLAWDSTPGRGGWGTGETITDRASATTHSAAARNVTATLRLHGNQSGLAYSLRARAVFFGDNGGRLDAGDRPETALPISAGTLITGHLDALNVCQEGLSMAGPDHVQPDYCPSVDYMPNLGEEDVPVIIPSPDTLAPPKPDPEPIDVRGPVESGAMLSHTGDLYRLDDVPAGTRIRGRVETVEPLALYHDLPGRMPNEVDLSILQPACNDEGEAILVETEDIEFAFYGEDTFVAPRTGDYFVLIQGLGASRYGFRIEQERVPVDVVLDPPRLDVVQATYPAEPVVGAPMSLALRLRNLPDFSATGVQVSVSLVDGATYQPVERATAADPRCRPAGAGRFSCTVGDMVWGGHADLLFRTRLPANGLRWMAEWETDDGAAEPAFSDGAVGLNAAPRIQSVFSVSDQTAAPAGVPSHPYPFNPGAREGSDLRYLFVTGWKLPQSHGDELDLTATDRAIEYRYVAWPDTDNPVYRDMYQRAWTRYRQLQGLSEEAPLPDGLTGLLVRANLREGIMPGVKSIGINGTEGLWALHFGGLEAQIRFVHASEALDIANAYIPESVEIVVEPNVPLPLDEIQLVLHEDRINNTGAVTHRIAAVREDDPDRRIHLYRTPPIVLNGPALLGTPPVRPGQIQIDAYGQAGRLVSLRATIDPDFEPASFALPVLPRTASIGVLDSPEDEPVAIAVATRPAPAAQSLFQVALQEAAACRDITVANWTSLDLQNREIDAFWNVVLLEFFDEDIRTEPVTIGHHAAALLLRATFIDHLDRAIAELNRIEQQDAEIVGLLHRMNSLDGDRSQPINRIEVTAPDGSDVEYGTAVAADDDAAIARDYGLGPGRAGEAAARAWRVAATRQALAILLERTRSLRSDSAALDPCDDIRDIIRMTGRGFGVIEAALEPKLRRLELQTDAVSGQTWTSWQYDPDGLFWMRELEPLMERVRRQEAAARQDNNLLIAMSAVISVPVSAGLGASGSAAYVMFAFAAADVGATAWIEARDYLSGQSEIDFSERAGIVLGYERHAAAELEAKAFGEMLFNIGLSAAFAGMDGVHVVRAIRTPAPVVAGLQVTRSIEQRGISSLTALERRQFAAFAMRSRLREIQLGRSAMTADEIQALDIVADVAARRTDELARTATPDPDATIVDSRVIRFELDADLQPAMAGVPEPTLPPGGRFEAVSRPPEEVGSGQLLADLLAEPSAGLSLQRGEHASHSGTRGEVINAQALGPGHANTDLELATGTGDTRRLSVGRFIDAGSTTAAYHSAVTTTQGAPTAIRLTFDTGMYHAADADALGEAVISSLGSPRVRLPEIVDTFTVAGAARYGVVRVQIAELVETAQVQIRNGRPLSQAQIELLADVIEELNAAGYVWLDFKWNNFGFVQSPGGELQVVIIDAGGIVRAGPGDPAMAREIQTMLSGEYERALPGAPRLAGQPNWRTGLRRSEVQVTFTPSADEQGVIERFVPAAGEDAEETIETRWRGVPFTPAIGEQIPEFANHLMERAGAAGGP